MNLRKVAWAIAIVSILIVVVTLGIVICNQSPSKNTDFFNSTDLTQKIQLGGYITESKESPLCQYYFGGYADNHTMIVNQRFNPESTWVSSSSISIQFTNGTTFKLQGDPITYKIIDYGTDYITLQAYAIEVHFP